ncbi:rhamnan synthesis F family protein [Candidatus Saccharibacteria bacterium]|nr:rhamnan synthesis F family protein [Candidatus Saccharibacteria bacterium]MCL1962901.1 rhamnan synthesis F family protein [Candidatus Saccharibacteria bacterium]
MVGTKGILFYVHFNKYNKVDDYVVYQLQQMKPIFDKVVLISNSKVAVDGKEKLNGLYDKFIQRKNTGFDFAAWRDGMSEFGWDKLSKYDELTIMNDTCFGPVFSIRPIYEKFEKNKDVDFWGGTIRKFEKHGMPIDGGSIPEHIQSYFMVFKKPVIESPAFQNFWKNVKDYKDVKEVIQSYETQLTGILNKAGYKYDAICTTTTVRCADELHLKPENMIKKRFPFIKKKAVRYTNFRKIRKMLSGSDGDVIKGIVPYNTGAKYRAMDIASSVVSPVVNMIRKTPFLYKIAIVIVRPIKKIRRKTK